MKTIALRKASAGLYPPPMEVFALVFLKKNRRSLLRLFCALLLLGLSLGLQALAFARQDFTEGVLIPFAERVISLLRGAAGLVPFSVAEWLVYFTVAGAIAFLVITVVRTVKNGWGRLLSGISILLLIAACIYLVFMLLWGVVYARPPLAERLELDARPRPVEELYETSVYVAKKLSEASSQIRRDEAGLMVPADFETLAVAQRVNVSKMAASTGFARGAAGLPKPVLLSEGLSYLGIAGIYFPFTGESNVNTNLVPFTLPFTMAHELSHAMLVAREDEANFCAFYATTQFGDEDARYSGWAMAFIYCSNALAHTDASLLGPLYEHLDPAVLKDFEAQSAYVQRYSGPVSEVSEQMNHHYLKAQGQSEGTKSYGRMVDLLVAWYMENVK